LIVIYRVLNYYYLYLANSRLRLLCKD